MDVIINQPGIEIATCAEISNSIKVEKTSVVAKLACPYCYAKFSQRRCLTAHLREKHNDNNDRQANRVCTHCNKIVHHRSLLRHLRGVHNVVGNTAIKGHRPLQGASESSDKLRTVVQGTGAEQSTIADNLLQLLPTTDYQYGMISYDEVESSSNQFTTAFTFNACNRSEFVEWKNKFQAKTCQQFTIVATKRCHESSSILFKQYLKCVHNKRIWGERSKRKNLACPSQLTVTIMRSAAHEVATTKYPCRIDLSWCHNHPVFSANVLRHHIVTPVMDEKLVDLFHHGHSPTSAWQCFIADIENNTEDSELLRIALADRSICPDVRHCQHIFKAAFKGKYKPKDISKLGEFIDRLNNEYGEKTVVREEFEGKNLIAICTPLMKRIHERIKEAGDEIYVDSSVQFDPRYKYKMFLLSTHCKAGVLPLAVGISASDSLELLTRLFHLIKQVLPDNAFFGRGRDHGPQLVMMNDSANEQGAIQNVWPGTQQLLSQFNVLQTTWQYLVLKDNNISVTDQPGLFALVKNMMYAPTHLDLSIQYETFLTFSMLKDNPHFREHISSLYETKGRLWCSVFRDGLRKELNEDQYQFRILKDRIFRRTSRFNIVQMTHFITDRLSSYYERRLLDYSSNRPNSPLRKISEGGGQQRIDTLSEDVFEIESSDDPSVSYTVNIATCMCSCPDGAQGKVCKHVHNVQALTDFSRNSRSSERDDDTREVMYFIACGCAPPAGWLDKTRDNSEQLSATARFNEVSTESLDNSSSGMDDNAPDLFKDSSVIAMDHEQSCYSNDTSIVNVDEIPVFLNNKPVSTTTDERDIINESSVATNPLITQQLKLARKEFFYMLRTIVNRDSRSSPVELLAAFRAATDTLKTMRTAEATANMLHTLGKNSDVGYERKNHKNTDD